MAVRHRQKDWAAALATASDLQGNLADVVRRERAARAALEQQLAERRAQYEIDIARAEAVRAMIDEQIHEAALAVERARHAEASAVALVSHLRQAEADAVARLAESEEQLSFERALAAERLAASQQCLEQETAARRRAEATLASAHIAHAEAEKRHEAALSDAVVALAAREIELASIAGSRDGFEQQLQDVEAKLTQETESRTACEQALRDLRSTAAAAEQRFRGEIDAITESARAEQAQLEDQMSRERHDHAVQLTSEQEQHRRAIAATVTRLAEREAQFKAELSSITATRDGLVRQVRDVQARLTLESRTREERERSITELRSAAAAAEQRFRDEIGTITKNARVEQARLEVQTSREHARLKEELASIAGSRDGLERQLQDVEARLTQETESRAGLEQTLAELRSTAAATEQRFRDEIGTITENAATERACLEEQMSNQRALADRRLAERSAEFEAELTRLSGEHANAAARLRASIAERDSRLEERARASAALRSQLDASENENRLQFEEAPVPLIRCTRDVSVAGVNRAFADLAGPKAHGELRDQSVAALFESRDDLIWLIERSMNSSKTELVETTCVRSDGTRIAVRLSARACASGLVEIAVDDLTQVRVLEDRLREARRMESVGRLASEVAVTCEKLLSDVYRDAQQLLATMTDAEVPQRSETLLDEVTRVGSFLHQLVIFGHEQEAALAPVDLNRVLRHLEPVLRQVAGDSVTLELRKTSSAVNVDVNAERVERLLVNVASYGRERMPDGGRLRIELSTVVVDGKFSAQHPNVRQGPHALITVTEAPRPIGESSVSDSASKPDARGVSERPGVDLSALQELISECGGHLWITAEPGGSMVVKMRLPLRAPWESQAERQARHGLGRVTARLLGR